MQRLVAVKKRLQQINDDLGRMIQNGSSYTQMHIEAELDAIIYEIDFGGIISQDIEYFYWDALEDISRPGKFQGQPAWVAFLYQCANHGMQTDELSLNPDVSGEVMIYFDDAPVLCPWPHTPKDAVIYIDEQGFVYAADYEHWLQALDEVEEDIEEEG